MKYAAGQRELVLNELNTETVAYTEIPQYVCNATFSDTKLAKFRRTKSPAVHVSEVAMLIRATALIVVVAVAVAVVVVVVVLVVVVDVVVVRAHMS